MFSFALAAKRNSQPKLRPRQQRSHTRAAPGAARESFAHRVNGHRATSWFKALRPLIERSTPRSPGRTDDRVPQ